MATRAHFLVPITAVLALAAGCARPQPGEPAAAPTAEIAFTRDGVAHIRAGTLSGAYYALGWATARDRAFQIELLRLSAEGRASEILGNRALRRDGFVRSLGVWERAQAIAQGLERQPFARRALQAYADGVNARFDSLARGTLPLPRDLRLVGHRPGRFTIVHCMGIALLQGLRLDADFPQLDFAALADRVGDERARAAMSREPIVRYFSVEDSLLGPPAAELLAVGKAAFAPDPSNAGRALAALLPPGGPGASNAWAVGAWRTRRNAPLLANDTHLGLSTPSTWYATHLVVRDTLDVIGLVVPGLPLFSVGRNRHLAWGVTALGAYAFEAYRESLDTSGSRTLYRGQWEPVRQRSLGLSYRLGPLRLPVFWVTARTTRHGVIVASDRKRRQASVVRWAATEPWPVFPVDLGWEQETTLEGFRARLGGVFSPTLNWVVASRDGRVLYQAAGWVARRSYLPGPAPTPGWDGEGEWSGPLTLDALPHVVRDPRGVVVSANNDPTAATAPIGDYSTAEWRAWRIRSLLAERRDLTVADMQAIAGDALSPQWPVFGPWLAAIAPELSAWDGMAMPSRVEPTMFRSWWNELNRSLDDPGREALLHAVLEGREPALWIARTREAKSGRRTSGETSADSAVAHAWRRAREKLARAFGADPAGWTWSRTHRARFSHALEDKDRGLTPPLVAVRGDRSSVCVGPSRLPADSVVTDGPSMRVVFDLADSTGWFIVPPGNSGDPDSPHYADLLEDWAAVRYRRFDLAWPRDEEIEARAYFGGGARNP